MAKQARKTSSGRIYVTFTINEDIKRDFNINCLRHGVNMSETVENFLINFNAAVEEAEKAKYANHPPTSNTSPELQVEFIDPLKIEVNE